MTPVGNSSNLLTSLLTAVLVKGKRELYHTIQYFEMQRLALTIVNDGSRRIFCAVITDTDVGVEFPKLVATQTLQKYIEEATSLNKRSKQPSLYQSTLSNSIPHSSNLTKYYVPSSPTTVNGIPSESTSFSSSSSIVSYLSNENRSPDISQNNFKGQRIFPSLKNPQKEKSFSAVGFNGMVSEEEMKTEDIQIMRIDPYLFQTKLRETFLSMVHIILHELRNEIGIVSADLISKDKDVLCSTTQSLDLQAYSDFLMSNAADIMNAVNDKPRSMEIVLSTATVVKIVQVEVSCNLIVMFQVPQSAILLSSEQDCATEEDVNSVVENIHSVIDWAVALLKKVQYLQKMT
ncbi:hypothetical protein C9374_003328 [Naegleria lovaniensis]|uniref:Uncharacterized protein n=1 Tax=Naegleria lovaniensis TaxID=51637 RepID=A0AA88GT18_NAELO|nr:uncharacterized protein C9374_003328 [Naegleria lovaniensis]KAG2385513.1 hypothetical protein C9374_003328 [Naegleria lovaniensis]